MADDSLRMLEQRLGLLEGTHTAHVHATSNTHRELWSEVRMLATAMEVTKAGLRISDEQVKALVQTGKDTHERLVAHILKEQADRTKFLMALITLAISSAGSLGMLVLNKVFH